MPFNPALAASRVADVVESLARRPDGHPMIPRLTAFVSRMSKTAATRLSQVSEVDRKTAERNALIQLSAVEAAERLNGMMEEPAAMIPADEISEEMAERIVNELLPHSKPPAKDGKQQLSQAQDQGPAYVSPDEADAIVDELFPMAKQSEGRFDFSSCFAA